MDEQSLDSHISLNTCPLKDKALLEGLSHQQRGRLARKSNSSLSEENQWFAIWEIIFPESQFPGLRRPISAYMDTGLSKEMRLFREYCSNHGPSALTGQIESDPAWSGSEITAEQRRVYLDRVIAQGLNSLFEAFINSDLPSILASSSTQSLNNMHSTPNLAGSIADSGVILESQLSSGETTYREEEVGQPFNVRVTNHQLIMADDRIQGNLTAQETTFDRPQSQSEDPLNMSLQDMTFDFSLFEASGTSAFDPFQYF
jgi:hypothetical protein